MSEQNPSSTEVMTAEQSFQCIMLARQILKLRISPDGYGMMETTEAVWRNTGEKNWDKFKGIQVEQFEAWPYAYALEIGVSPFPRGKGEWNNPSFTDEGSQRTAAVRGVPIERPALAEISYWRTADDNLPLSVENPGVVYYHLGAEQEPSKTVEYRDPSEEQYSKQDTAPAKDEATLVIADLMNVLAIAQELGPIA